LGGQAKFLSAGTDIFTYTDSGFYAGFNITNAPSPRGYTFYVNKYSDSYCSIIAVDVESWYMIYFITKVNGVWQSWQRLTVSSEIPTSLPANGGNADTATYATSATNATEATYATNAGNADKVDGYEASAFLRDIGSFLVTNGYMQLSNGLILEWGRITDVTGNDYYLTFPLAFPNFCLSIVATLNMNDTGNNYVYETKIRSYSQNQAHLFINGTAAFWIAIGY
jgi:hypothetical protein